MQAPPDPTSTSSATTNPSHVDPYSHIYTQLQPSNPNPSNLASYDLGGHAEHGLSMVSTSVSHVTGYDAVNHGVVDSLMASSAYYQDPSAVATVQNWQPAVQQLLPNLYLTGFATPQNGAQQPVSANLNFATLWNTAITKPQYSAADKRFIKKKTKVVQSVWCELCKVDCNSRDILEKHKFGKKHKKNLEKLAAAAAAATAPASSVGSKKPLIGPQENPDKGKSVGGTKAKRKAAQQDEDLETKRRKIMEGGAAASAIRVCAICNVVCNSEVVFRYHLVGQKHAAMIKKHTSEAGIAAM